jgi:Cu-Zn family superoxide dismutase
VSLSALNVVYNEYNKTNFSQVDTMRRSTAILLPFVIFVLTILALQYLRTSKSDALSIPMYAADGTEVGVIVLHPVPRGRMLITVNLWNISEGFHGFHIHEVGRCEVNDEGNFITAGGHFDMGTHTHGDHAGDLPLLEAGSDGRAYISFHTPRFSIEDLQDMDGSTFIVHANPDNFANIPDRYGTTDETTLSNGDAGARIACGVIAPAH